MKKVYFSLILFFIFISCNNSFLPFSQSNSPDKMSNTGSIKIFLKKDQLSKNISRTIINDSSKLHWHVALSREGYTNIESEATGESVIISNIDVGVWKVTVTGMDADKVVAIGESIINIALGQTISCNVDINYSQTGSGSFLFDVIFPKDIGIDTVSAKLYKSGVFVDTPVEIINSEYSSTQKKVSISSGGIASGQYELVINFKRATTDAGTFREAVNIFDNTISNKWLASDGLLKNE
ncbi:MAG TPA: hypothetical protein PK771_12470, partial [Spirochaetota bacterium]|nr:hypothetical protein [Spirochaetota bacterium]